MKKKDILISVAIIAAAGLTLVLFYEPIEEGRCTLHRRKANPESQLLGLAHQFITPLTDKPDRARDVPSNFQRPCYYEIKSGDRSVLMAADFSQKLTRLCIDNDGDGFFSKEQCFTARPSKETPVSSKRQKVGPISLVSGKSPSGTDGEFYINCFREDVRGLLIPFPAFYREGKLCLANRTYRVALVDGDRDGLYRSILSLPLDRSWPFPVSDIFAIDLNQNGEFEMSLSKRSEVMPLGNLVKVADKYYAINVAPDGRNLELSRTEPQFGTLVIESNDVDVKLKLWSDAAEQYLFGSERTWQIPAGIYSSPFIELNEIDSERNEWTFSSYRDTGPLRGFEIRPGQTTSFRLGPPFAIKTKVEKIRDRVLIGMNLEGCAGERYRIPVLKGGRPQPESQFKVVNESREVLLSEQFQYG